MATPVCLGGLAYSDEAWWLTTFSGKQKLRIALASVSSVSGVG